MILIIKHIDIEGPGTLGDFLAREKILFKLIDLGAGDKLPTDFSSLKAVVVLGGPMNVYEEDRYPFLKEEGRFIKEILKRAIPYLGICLGSQLLSKAAGGSVVKSPKKEVGWFQVRLTADGQKDPFFKGLNPNVDVFHWHEDMFMVPEGGKLLATADGCPNQAFRVGKNAYGLQFHCEITDVSIKEWTDEYVKRGAPGREEEKQAMLKGYAFLKPTFDQTATVIYENFLKITELSPSPTAH